MKLCFFCYILECPKSIRFFIGKENSSLCTTWSIKKNSIKHNLRWKRKIFLCLSLYSFDTISSLKLGIVHKFIVADLILLKSNDFSFIFHDHCQLRRLRSWCSTDVKNSIIFLWIKYQYRQHAREGLEIDLPTVESISSLEYIVILSVKKVCSLNFFKFLNFNSFLFELRKDFTSISSESIYTK